MFAFDRLVIAACERRRSILLLKKTKIVNGYITAFVLPFIRASDDEKRRKIYAV